MSGPRLAEGTTWEGPMSFRETGSRERMGSARNQRRPTGMLFGVSKVVIEVEDRERANASALERTEALTP
jgi:hypothetical protein